MTDIRIRDALPSDREGIVAIWMEGWHDAHGSLFAPEVAARRTVDDFRRRAAYPFDRLLVACRDSAVIGFIALRGREVDQLYVGRGARGTGVADRLLAAAEDALAQAGVEVVRIECAVGNVRARDFYVRHGYADAGIEDRPIWTAPDEAERSFPMHRFDKTLSTEK
ncbi:GNAT family N-acetyltransferase [Methylobrevis pamukkalensis]|uniref:Putative acetyltransferase n=1 Tax=Methylobrevis pamukkalensis TaxID=1439726 RepID=A0A1E3H315_9HYPH|nr:GNAT family N-acetyltransferase [Methylobrevis pamukkalensis]ODN69931.1 putative acetyltransferase [Methylobrevis pamukkalensis]